MVDPNHRFPLVDLKRPGSRKFLIIAGEESGDIYAATLIKRLKSLRPDLTVEGIGGDRFRKAGGKTLYDIADIASVGLGAAFLTLSYLIKVFADLKGKIIAGEYDAIILIDFPDFNLRIAKVADASGAPVFYYVCPQFWAWRRYRIKAVRKWVDMMIVILPFESDFYKGYGVDARFFGHPILDELPPIEDRKALRQEFGASSNDILLGILPGSRKGEVTKMLPDMLRAVKLVGKRVAVIPVIACADSIDDKIIKSVAKEEDVEVSVVKGRTWEVMNAADFLICKSGTSTLQAAIAKTPMVVVYRGDWFTYLLAKALVHISWVALPNLIAEREIVPELLQGMATPENIAETTLKLLTDDQKLSEMKVELATVRGQLGEPGAPAMAATAILDFLDRATGAK